MQINQQRNYSLSFRYSIPKSSTNVFMSAASMCVKGERNMEHIEMTANKRHSRKAYLIHILALHEIYMTRSN